MTAPTFAALASAFPTATGPQINEALVLVASMNATSWGADHTAATLAQASLFLSRDKLLKAPGYWKGYEQTLFDLNKARPTGESEAEIATRLTAAEAAIVTNASAITAEATARASADSALDSPTRSKKTASFTAAITVGIYLVDTSAGDVVVTLPATVEHGWLIYKETTDTNKITLRPTGTDNIDGANADSDLVGSPSAARGAWRVTGTTVAGVAGYRQAA